MRVSELANELGKTSKEILEIIKTKDKSAVLYAASNVTKDQENIVRSFANPKRDAKPAAPEHRTEAPKQRLPGRKLQGRKRLRQRLLRRRLPGTRTAGQGVNRLRRS